MGCDLIPPKLVKTAADQLAKLFTCIFNSAIAQSIFPNEIKEASVTPVDKGENEKHIFPNYRLVSVLNTFSKIIELSIFDQITISANEFFSVFMGCLSRALWNATRAYTFT